MTASTHVLLEHKKVPMREMPEEVAKNCAMVVPRQENIDISLLSSGSCAQGEI
ncbi:hypothetical protein V7S43_001877 [Phytophthora oleae]|uniref:Uncharacterized protein n=1 Tax=Phytophthora oleae TaxID=2107226 RepID=A0ABD3G1U0_9STRA